MKGRFFLLGLNKGPQPGIVMKEPVLKDLFVEIKTLRQEVQALRRELKAGPVGFLDVREAARFLGLAERTVRKRSAPKSENPLPVKAIRQGSKVLFRREDLQAYADSMGAQCE